MASPNPPRINNESIRYIDSSFDQADSLRNRNQNPDATLNLAPIPYSDGKMVGPGQGGFRLADTPQAWVFIQKKEWLDDTWTYVVNDPPLITKLISDLEISNAEMEQLRSRNQDTIEIRNQIQALQQKISKLEIDLNNAKQQMADNGIVSQIEGKLTQIDIRSALSNIITRKIDWVADHEKFTKSTTDYNNSVEIQQFARQKEYIQNNFGQIQGEMEKNVQKLKEKLEIYNKAIDTMQSQDERNKQILSNIKTRIDNSKNSESELDILRKQQQDKINEIEELKSKSNNLLLVLASDTKPSLDNIKRLNSEIESLQKPSLSWFVSPEIKKQDSQSLASKQADLAIAQSNVDHNTGYANAQVDKINEEIAKIQKEIDIIALKISEKKEQIEKEKAEKKEEDKKDNEALQTLNQAIDTNQKVIQDTIIARNDLFRQIQEVTNSLTFNFDTGKLYAPVTFSGNAYTRYYKSPLFRTKTNTEAAAEEKKLKEEVSKLKDSLVKQTGSGRVGSQELLLQTQLEYIDTKRRLDKITTQISAQYLDAPISIEVGKETFNGVIELANVSQISTTVNLEGEGSASFTIENPQNIFFIGQEDIDLALSQDPFLEGSRSLEGMVYYRGHFYPDYIVDMLVRRKGYSAGTFNVKESLLSSIVNQMGDIKKKIEEVNIQLSVSANLLAPADAARLQSKRAGLVAEYLELQEQQKNLSTSLSSYIQKETNKDASRNIANATDFMNLIRQTLVKYYVGKSIFQVMDRVYIWMTSPTRTLHQLSRKGNEFAIEDQSAMIMARQVPAMEEKLALLQEEKGKLKEYLLNANEKMGFNLNHSLSTANGKSYVLTFTQAESYFDEIHNEIEQVQATIKVLQAQSKSTDHLTGAMTFNKVPSSPGAGRDKQEQTKIISDYDSRYLGIEEDRLQVFQGIISSVKQTFSGGKYQISFSCRDNLVFLSMSRIMIKPALRAEQDPQGILQDPIWRGNKMSGNWKNGIAVLDYAFINDEVRMRMNKKFNINTDVQANLKAKVLSEEETKITGVSPYVTSLPFAKIDAANLISFIITGFPYNFKSFVKNAAFGGRISLQRGSADQRGEKSSYFAFLKRQVGELNDRLGDFEPYIDLNGNQFSGQGLSSQITDFTKQLTKSSELLDSSYEQHVLLRIESFFKRLQDLAQGASLNSDPLVDSLQASKATLAKAVSYINATSASKTILISLKKIIQDAAQREKNTTTGSAIEGIYNTNVAKESEIEQIINLFFDGKSDLGSFQVAKSIALEAAESQLKSTLTGGVQNPPSRPGFDFGLAAQNAQTATAAKTGQITTIAKAALTSFIKSLLTIQPGFAIEYYNTALIASNLNNLNDVQVDIRDYLSDIQSQSVSIRMDARDGPQSTLEKVVRGEKKNFLIISDQYELDLDLQAYQSQVGTDFALFQSEWETPMSICKRAADQVDFEFYADENGNLQFKPPSYNRILKEHFGLISETDGQVRNAILIRYGDTDGLRLKSYLRAMVILRQLMAEYSAKRLSTAIKKIATQNKIPSQERVKANETDLAAAYNSAATRPDPIKANTEETQNGALLGQVLAWSPIRAEITAEQQAEELSQLIHRAENQEIGRISISISEKERTLQDNRQLQETYKAKLQEAEKANDPKNITNYKFEISRNQLAIDNLVTEIDDIRFKAKKNLYNQLYDSLESQLKGANKTLEAVRQKTESFVNALPHFMDEHRIHRVADHDLISYDFNEDAPKFTYLEVTGSPDLVQLTPSEYYWAGGVDYDNWRQYGFISENINKAYFHSGNQARTYLRAMLGRERGRIFKASLSVRGDSKYRVGDCVFIECLGMYFYVSSVSQSFSYGGDYSTSLSLTYGRRIGEIIPHPFDVLGKIMIDTYQSDLEELLAQQKYLDTKENTKI